MSRRQAQTERSREFGRVLPRVAVFDLGDTILAYSADVEPSWRAVCEIFAAHVAPVGAEALLREIQAQAERYWGDPEIHRRGRLDLIAARQEICPRALRRFGREDTAPALAMSRKRFELHEKAILPFPGAVAALDRLRSDGVRLALITNGAADVQAAKIDRFGLRGFFDSIMCEGAFGCGKPDPRVFRHTLEVLGVDAADAWMVGDNLTLDIAPAMQLGMVGIWNDHAGRGLPADSEAQPDRIIRSIGELVC